jgi:hypothetical protein
MGYWDDMINAVGLAYACVLRIEFVPLKAEQLSCEEPDNLLTTDSLWMAT